MNNKPWHLMRILRALGAGCTPFFRAGQLLYFYLGLLQVMENLESHGKQYAWRKDVLKIEKNTDESETGFNFRSYVHEHTFYAL